jgi:FSR family fosmidomycin resistance protein-like MFS transporter
MRALLPSISFVLTLLIIEFADEFVFGAREAAWPLIRNDLHLTYLQIGLLLSVPNVVGNMIEPVIGILGDVWNRRALILGGGVIFTLALLITAISQSFWALLVGFVIFYPASGAFVSLSQAALMDAEPDRHEQNMARWTFAGSLGIVVGPLVLGIVTTLGWSWRVVFLGFAGISLFAVTLARRYPFSLVSELETDPSVFRLPHTSFISGVRNAFKVFGRKDVIRWLAILEFSNLPLDILHGYLALYFVDIVGLKANQAVFAVAVWTGFGLIGDFLLISLLQRVNGLKYLRVSAVIVLFLFPAFLLSENPIVKVVLIGTLGMLNAGWYAIPKGQLYSAMPGQSGTVMTVGNIFNLFGSLIPFGLGLVAQEFGLQNAMWLILLGPIVLLFGIPRRPTS